MSHVFSLFAPCSNGLRRLAATLCFCLIAGMAAAQPARFSDVETGWTYWYSANAATINGLAGEGQRVINLERVGTGATYDAVAVTNSGSYAASGTVVVYNQTVAQLSTYLNDNNRRPLDLEVDESSGQERITAVTVPNSGGTAVTGWQWGMRLTQAQITTWMSQNPTYRLMDLEAYTLGAQKHYGFVAVHNSGTEQRSPWGVIWDATPTTINTTLAAGGPRLLLDLELESAGTITNPPRFSGIWVNAPASAGHWWYSGLDAQGVSERLAQHGARLLTLKRYSRWDGATRFAVSMIDNVNAETRRIRAIMDGRESGGITGFQIKRAGNHAPLASLNQDYVFEPASTLKIAHSAGTILRVAQGLETLNQIENYNDPTDPDACPNTNEGTTGPQRSLGHIIRQTMRRSDNRATRHLRRLLDDGGAAFSGVNAFIAAQGLSSDNTLVQHDIGCGAPPNRFTATDAVRMYERIGDGSIFSAAWRDVLFDDHMLNWPLDRQAALNTIITQEVANTQLQPHEATTFRDTLRVAWKGGGYEWGGLHYRSQAGWARLPHRSVLGNGFVTLNRDYALAMFHDSATLDCDIIQNNVCVGQQGAWHVYNDFHQLLRLPIREALQSWDAACTPPTASATPASVQAVAGSNVNLNLLLGGTNVQRSFQWQRHNGTTWVNLSDTPGVHTGTTTGTLTLHNVNAQSAGQYRARVDNYCGNTFSNATTVSVTAAGMGIFSNGFE